ncbi:E3 ubiquitin-protein ligase rnf13 [Chytriomyces hyalinus]|nr:E3 ubiquitin-protein ligase rnf13 [Chytriomyces hyalinus]
MYKHARLLLFLVAVQRVLACTLIALDSTEHMHMSRMRCRATQLGSNTLPLDQILKLASHHSHESNQPPHTTYTHQSLSLFQLEFDRSCTPVSCPTSITAPFVALVPYTKDPSCSPTQMTLAAQNAGAAAVIVAETATVPTAWWPVLVPESHADSRLANRILIPSVFTGYAEYQTLMHIMQDEDYSDGVWIRIIPDPSGIYLLYMLLVFAWPFFFVALFETNLYLKKRWLSRNALRAIHGMRVRVVRNETSDLSPLLVDQDPADTACSVCLEEYATGEEIRILPCNHEFHAKCVDKWLTNEVGVCPLCKQSIHPPGYSLVSDLDMLRLSDDEQDASLLDSFRRNYQFSDSREADAVVPSLGDLEY